MFCEWCLKRRRVVHAVRDRPFLFELAGIWDGEWSVVARQD